MANNWMIRAGRGGKFIEDFEKGFAAIGWNEMGDLSDLKSSDEIRARYIEVYGNDKPAKTSNAVSMLVKFRDVIKAGDVILSYSSESREYLYGIDKGKYSYQPEFVGPFGHIREVDWQGKVSRDSLSQKAKNQLGSVLTMFKVSDEVIEEFKAALAGEKPVPKAEVVEADVESEDVPVTKDDTVNQSHELIKDKVVALSPEEMEELTAAILRAMGYKSKVAPKGPDRGVDVIASPDGLGLQTPRIKAEVKHRGGSMGAPAIRGFIGALREGDSGLFVSTGGFTREARYEAERSTLPLTLVDLDDLADLIVTHYETFDLEGRALVPLVRLYWPID